MCGITGYLDRFKKVEEQSIRNMCSRILHRGPDDEGIYCRDNLGIGMRRLSIIDIEGGHQPIANEDETLRIVFNGEIYNYRELYNELEKDGHAFRTRSDTEVIVHLYEKYGVRCVDRLNGMFAFAVLDDRNKCIFIARDRMGIKPLYYSLSDKKFLFASEIKSLLVDNGIEKNLNIAAIWDYLSFRYVPEPDTIWKGIYKLPPAHWMKFDITTWRMNMRRYWDIPYQRDNTKNKAKSDNDYLREFSELFEDSVSRHLQADVPVGILLSGGLDSSAVLSAVNRVHNGKIYSFSIGFEDGGEFSELEYARIAARDIGAINHEVIIGHKEFVDFLDDFVWFTDEPLADLASVPLYYVSKLASSHVKVVLSGEGSDEILAGYDLEHIFSEYEKQRERIFLPSWIMRIIPDSVFKTNVNYYDQPSRNLFHMTNIFPADRKKQLMGGDHADSLLLLKNYYKRVKDVHPLNQILYVFSQSWLVEDLLMKADKMTMANSIELRVPFLDYRLVEWAARLPVRLKIGGYHDSLATKKVLRMYSDDKVPSSIIKRSKKGFPVPAYDWLSNKLKSFATEMINHNSRVAEYFNVQILKEIVQYGTASGAGILDRHRLWSILILEIWMKRWLKR
jgi:asparagine synthase (glutamine-hydrolysing)